MVIIGEFTVPYRVAPPFKPERWNHRRALRFGAFSAGRFRVMLNELGLRWNEAFNLCPPGIWDETAAVRVADEAIAYYRPGEKIVLVGQRVASVFKLKAHFFETQDRFLVIPYPTQIRTWEECLKTFDARLIFRNFLADDLPSSI